MGRQALTGAEEDMAGVGTVRVTVRHRMRGVATALQVEVLTARDRAGGEDMDRHPVEEVDTVLVAATAETECEVEGHRLRATRGVGHMIVDLRRQMHMEITRRVVKPLQPRRGFHMI